ncbi:MAG TPA: HdeD family acid-resistance protein [Pyrinomonadaceae bacterium]|nr:HdeD family acid-resistance protein [Pyrinomonadaceae bacterium]
MFAVYAGSWWALVLRGIAAILFGVLAFVWPAITLTALVFLWGAYALVDGAFAIAAGIKIHGENKRWWVLLLEGILSVAAGVLAFAIPGITALVLLILIAAWAIVTGVFEIAAAIQLRKYITGEWMLVLAGIASVLFGALLFLNPTAGALAVVWLIGAYAIVFGVLLVALGIRLHSMIKTAGRMSPRAV